MVQADIGVYGLGTMGSALALNLAEKGFEVAVSNREADWLAPFLAEAGSLSARIAAHAGLDDFVASLKAPRMILFMIPSGAPVDDLIAALQPYLSAGDTLIDGGNSDFHDTRRRAAALSAQGLHFVGMGVSGGEEGARTGPSMMVGGTGESWNRLRPMAEAIAAQYQGSPCVAHLGPDGAGHFVKTVHNGIEYADMQMIAEIYGLLRDGVGWSPVQIAALFRDWSDGPLASYLIEIAAEVLEASDPATGDALLDSILDSAGQKGTGRWTVIEALKLGQSASTIEAAVGARAWSSETRARQAASGLLSQSNRFPPPDRDVLAQALLAGRLVSHAQGFRLLSAASEVYDWSLDLARIAEIWRAGCIIRSALLDDIADAFRADPPHGHLILAPHIAMLTTRAEPALRRVVSMAIGAGLPVPSLAAALGWKDSMAQARGNANMIQALRDRFGAHGFFMQDGSGPRHGPWHGD
ncbi:NADP-dependent phosphogluconate dehydrogenase [Thalassococcus sp. S3]|uniref:NADP-dependent phosphogluconate dehydrogenase n=1 Tax=Thalassococcus sp. S3 TaxID=2017482 RepID=UPI00102488C0|nr:NADP-dependent phosphogluconate dehydrogenase [Thalassococcus sp. S3]QBF31003.1 phosphogluconate dehydrogenase (NADP(+)-dependent, decarboxylating) [Thalassococcus sp. S3]